VLRVAGTIETWTDQGTESDSLTAYGSHGTASDSITATTTESQTDDYNLYKSIASRVPLVACQPVSSHARHGALVARYQWHTEMIISATLPCDARS
jgi:hypothetical protein